MAVAAMRLGLVTNAPIRRRQPDDMFDGVGDGESCFKYKGKPTSHRKYCPVEHQHRISKHCEQTQSQ